MKINIREIQRGYPTSGNAIDYVCKNSLPIDSIDDLVAFDKTMNENDDFKVEYVRFHK